MFWNTRYFFQVSKRLVEYGLDLTEQEHAVTHYWWAERGEYYRSLGYNPRDASEAVMYDYNDVGYAPGIAALLAARVNA